MAEIVSFTWPGCAGIGAPGESCVREGDHVRPKSAERQTPPGAAQEEQPPSMPNAAKTPSGEAGSCTRSDAAWAKVRVKRTPPSVER